MYAVRQYVHSVVNALPVKYFPCIHNLCDPELNVYSFLRISQMKIFRGN